MKTKVFAFLRSLYLASPTWSARPTTECEVKSTSLWVHRNLFWQLSRDGNFHGSGMSHAMTASQNHSSGHLGGRGTLWPAEEMLDGQSQRVDVSAYSTTAPNGLPQKRLEKDLYWIVPHVPQTTLWFKELNWTTSYIISGQMTRGTLATWSKLTSFRWFTHNYAATGFETKTIRQGEAELTGTIG